jgi:hypothetical protein
MLYKILLKLGQLCLLFVLGWVAGILLASLLLGGAP